MTRLTSLIALILVAAPFAWADDAPATEAPAVQPEPFGLESLATNKTLTNNWFGLGKQLQDSGITLTMSLTQVYQINLQGGNASNSGGEIAGVHRRSGRYVGGYDIEAALDLEKIAGIPGAKFIFHGSGGWSEGLNASSVGAYMNVNNKNVGYDCRVLDLKEAYWDQNLFDGRLRFRIGKLALDGGYTCRHCDVGFDANAFANDDSAQFLNSALCNNPTIPLPQEGLGATVYVEPIDGFFLTAGVGDADADFRETGFNTAFHGPDNFFAIFETGIAPVISSPWGDLPGGYRVGMWYDPQPKTRFVTGTTKRDDIGFYLSFDQYLYMEEPESRQGLGAFFRYGWADGDVNDAKCFWSLGMQYQGLIPTRDADVLGIGYANAKPGADPTTTTREQVWEFYYNVEVTPWLHVTPSLQFVKDPGMTASAADATVVGLRAHIDF